MICKMTVARELIHQALRTGATTRQFKVLGGLDPDDVLIGARLDACGDLELTFDAAHGGALGACEVREIRVTRDEKGEIDE